MPNHVKNILTFNGSSEEVKRLRNAIKNINSEGEEQAIDFEKIISMPVSMKITSGSRTDYGFAVILFRERGDDSKLKPILDYPWVKAENIKTAEQLANYLVETDKADVIQGKQALDNLDTHGFKDWYSWSIANWGTKWNAYSIQEIEEEKISFDTAWSTPYPVVEELSSMFPDVEITLEFADEDFGYNCGKIVFSGGVATEEFIPEAGSAEAHILADKIHDYGMETTFFNIGHSDDEEFLEAMIAGLFETYSPREVLEEVDFSSREIEFSDTFLAVLKQALINAEEYELMALYDKIKVFIEKEGEE